MFGIDDAIVGGLVAATGSIGGSLISGASNAQTIEANKQMAGVQDAFQYNMSSTALQRAVADAKAAGINPMSITGGSGAQSGTGASIAAQNPYPSDFIGKSVSSALDGIRAVQTLQQNQAQIRKTKAEADTQEALGKKTGAEASKSGAQLPAERVEGKLWQAAEPYVDYILDRVQGHSAGDSGLNHSAPSTNTGSDYGSGDILDMVRDQ